VTLSASAEQVAARWQTAFGARDLAALETLLDEHVRWGGAEETPQTCHTRAEVLARLARVQDDDGLSKHTQRVDRACIGIRKGTKR